jgi:ABC-type multidrug transport system ATPase subunit
MSLADSLRRVPLFKECSGPTLDAVAAALEPISLGAGAVVVREGDPGDRFFLVAHGALAVSTGSGGHATTLARLGPGDFFGEIALLTSQPRTATVTAETEVRLWALTAEQFRRVMQSEPHMAAAVNAIVRSLVPQPVAASAPPPMVGSSAPSGVSSSAPPMFQDAEDPNRSTLSYEVQRVNLADLLKNRDALRIGRHTTNDLVLSARVVSRFHAVISRRGSTYEINDLGSLAGTFVNGKQVRSSPLVDGDEVWIATERFVFRTTGLDQIVEPRGIRIDADRLSRQVKAGTVLLNEMSLTVLPGELVAIVGGSGAGKSTLLNALSGVNPATGGRLLYNGRDYYANLPLFRTALGYVPQDDIIHTELPLRRTLRHAARLRLPVDTTRAEVATAVDDAIQQLSLAAQSDLPVHRMSGGQRKRCSIGVELLTQPRIFFLDEPTSGLDPATDGQMMRLFRQMADSGSTVFVTTHATKNVTVCDKVVFLASGGYLAYFGTPDGALRYFGSGAFDEIYDILEQAPGEQWAARFVASPEHQPSPPFVGDERVAVTRTGPWLKLRTALRQLRVLSARNADARLHDPAVMGPLMAQSVIMTLLLLSLFGSGVFDRHTPANTPMQLLLLLSFMSYLVGLLTSIGDIAKELPIFLRERMVGLSVVPYVISKATFLMPALAGVIGVILTGLYVTNRLPHRGMDFYGPLYVTLLLAAFAGISIGLMTSSLVNTETQATDILPAWIMPQVLFSGALFPVPTIALAGRIASNFSVVRWAFEANGNVADLLGLWRSKHDAVAQGALQQYRTTFDNSLTGHWMILGGFFVLLPLTLACLRLRTKRPK